MRPWAEKPAGRIGLILAITASALFATLGASTALARQSEVASPAAALALQGVFYNTNLKDGGLTTMSLTISGSVISGPMNFTGRPEDSTALCAAGVFSGTLVGNNFTGAFTSHDTDLGCGYDHGGLVTLTGTVDLPAKHLWADFSLKNAGSSSFIESGGVAEMWTPATEPQPVTYGGVITNTHLHRSSPYQLTVVFGALTVNGYLHVIHRAAGPLLCGAGNYSGIVRLNSSFEGNYFSEDPDSGCASFNGQYTIVRGTFTNQNRNIAGGDFGFGPSDVSGNYDATRLNLEYLSYLTR